jgi:hypothetical protein
VRLTLRAWAEEGGPGALIAETDLVEGDLWIEMARLAYNVASGYEGLDRRQLLASDFHGGTYPFGVHTLTFGRYAAITPVCDAPVWMKLERG